MINNEIKNRTIALYLPTLDLGGAEKQVLELAKGLDKSKWRVIIIANRVNPLLNDELAKMAGVKIIQLEKNCALLYLLKLLGLLYREKPCLINAYLVSAQTYTLLLHPFFPKIKVIFSVRDALDYSEYYGQIGIFFKMLLLKSSWLVNYYIFNSFAGRNARSGLPDRKVQVIPNGIDTNRFHPGQSSRTSLRQVAGIGENDTVVGIVGNFSIYKGYDTFIKAARVVADQMPDVHFVTIGDDDTAVGKEMRVLVDDLSLSSVFHFFGLRTDVPSLLPGMDILCSSSVTEGFSNSICEGMASGVPCVVTNVGDSALIIGSTGIVVPAGEPELMAKGILQLLKLSPEERRNLGMRSRNRIEENFFISRMVTETEKVFESLLQ